jgi:hypothetical protein
VTVLVTYAGLAGFAWLAVFQMMLAAGLPLGRMAWGGVHRIPPPHLRLSSLIVAGVAGLGAVTLAQDAGIGPAILPVIVVRPLLWTFTAVFALSLLANLASRSPIERLHGVPLTVILALACGVVALR